MTAGWVAVSVRAQAMTSRRCGRDGAARLAATGSVEAAVEMLSASTYGHDVHPGQDLATAQRAVVQTVVWNLRVLAGWSPREGVTLLRALVAWLEIANTLDQIEALQGREVPAHYRLGGLGTAWSRLREASDVAGLRSVLTASPWGDPGGDSPRAIGLSMQAAAADRLVAVVPEVTALAGGGVALLLARQLGSADPQVPAPPAAFRASAARVVGRSAVTANNFVDLAEALPGNSRWAVAEVAGNGELWRAEARWWRRVDHDGMALVRRSTPGRAVLVGSVAVLAADAWRVRAALERAARGGGPGEEDFDAVA